MTSTPTTSSSSSSSNTTGVTTVGPAATNVSPITTSSTASDPDTATPRSRAGVASGRPRTTGTATTPHAGPTPVVRTSSPEPGDSGVLGVTRRRVIRAEWIKLWSLRSTVVTLGAVLVAVVSVGWLVTAINAGDLTSPGGGPLARAATRDATGLSLSGVDLGALIIGILGVAVVAGEYSTGLIRTTLAAVPRRLPVLWAKSLVLGFVALAVSGVAVVTAFWGGQMILGADGASLADPGVARAVASAAAYLAGVGVLGVALGAALRSTSGAIGTLFGGLMVAPGLVMLLPDSWSDVISPYLPSSAGSAMMSVAGSDTLLEPLAGAAVFAAYVVVALATAAVVVTRRDA